MKIRLVDGTIYLASRVEITNGRLEIDIQDKTAEEVQAIFNVPANLTRIQLLTDENEVFGDGFVGWTVYGGVMLNGQIKTAILTKETDTTQERIVNAEANALAATAAAEEAKTLAGDNATQVTDLQLAICELYEGLGV